MFIYVFNKELKNKLINSGFKLLTENDLQAVFVLDEKVKFDFASHDKSKFLITNRLTF